MTLFDQLEEDVKDFKERKALDIVYENTCKNMGDFGGLGGLIDHCLKNGFIAEAELLKITFGE